MKTGLLGRKLGHSYSPQIHRNFGNYDYSLFEKEPEDVEEFLKNGDFSAINVTYPYKKTVMPYCKLTSVAERIGAVNTIVRQPDGTLLGHNTDYFGFYSMVKRSGLNPAGKKCLVLGSGGASATAVAAMTEMGARVVVISRNGDDNYTNLNRHADAAIVCNCTPVGMYPNTGISPVELDQFPALEGVLDVIYNPARTQLLLDAEKLGLPHENGLWMLVAQAKEAAEYFGGKPICNSEIQRVYHKMSADMQNIVLIGMPGCGKTTVASMLAEKLGRIAVDADEEIVKLAGKTIPDIFAQDGEEVFREWETKVLTELGKQSQLIIATGGGCVTKQRNHALLHQNGSIFWLERRLDKLPTQGRPLSQKNRPEDLYLVRKPLYEAFADYRVDNNGSCQETVQKIISILEGNL